MKNENKIIIGAVVIGSVAAYGVMLNDRNINNIIEQRAITTENTTLAGDDIVNLDITEHNIDINDAVRSCWTDAEELKDFYTTAYYNTVACIKNGNEADDGSCAIVTKDVTYLNGLVDCTVQELIELGDDDYATFTEATVYAELYFENIDTINYNIGLR